ncbi:MAG: CusA/CzcA family heavy metal efflux RND transporter [Flavobacteriales bacterium]|jgi:cobalt-zinc-cadmium resistance protein CzcA|uniref:CusA/CzcA family heavy metal efflux RND transporter n=1 Tax=Candidatus Ulvibacter alkanivorans TaxID=2267620 RepID=UPI000C95F20B|nr:CusA/CzcA family heavy metal efflux RND transporter [Candidatus Ulvibacter alkanivorans]MAO49508.1 CusA/CzcA family heavy metal efflux RND transporter [Pusillimonas sp.]MCH2490423.1 CusA/CzcA family heavy metal efflux RND transporter [Flavobacteriales bacterium]HIB47263.1 CusA/CzcA family heavy metal efflux RND transporter [Flavobacteriaceae bacterium]HIN98499.1 CusA/CzcA family heavy metal efflux RND transporter [Flavobacteriaceae bacterium]|tara:strand:+ start:1472 stop:5875 length:4404 start_codon:yes stop_codon:yes gene_type:complete
MINKIISFSINNKFIIGLFIVTLVGTGIWSMATINLGSVPDITNNQVQVITVAPNLGTEDIEQFVTYPVELAMANLPDVIELRSVSRFGLSVVTIVFKDEAGTYLPRQLVQEKLTEVAGEIPEGFGTPFMAPITTGLGEIYQYTLKLKEGYEDKYDAMELRTIQDWIVKRQMALVPGVVEVNAFGGYVKQYEVAINPNKLKSFGITMNQVFEALKANNANTGGAYIEKNHQANFIRGEGLARSIEDLENTVVTTQNGSPVLIRDVAEKVGFGNQVRYGAFTQDGHETVGGQILMLKGESPGNVVENVEKRIVEIQKSLPEGVYIDTFLSRSELIGRTTSTVEKNLIEGSLIVIFVLVLLLGSFRGGLITASVIPLSLLFAFILMKQFGVWANLMSLGAIDFGIIVDGAVIIVEGMVFHIHQRMKKSTKVIEQAEMDEIAYESASTMMNSAFFGQLIILIVFTPILFLTGVEGKMFRPMAFTFGFAVLGAIILCLTYVPMISAMFLKPTKNQNSWFAKFENKIDRFSDKIMAGLNRAYLPLLNFALRFRAGVVIGAVALLLIAGFIFSNMGGEFIPKFDEGDIAFQALIKPGSSLTESIEASKKLQNLINEFPEVKTVVSRIGVAEIPTDPMPMDIADSYIILEKDKSKWTSADSKEELIEKIQEKISVVPGVNFVFTQPVELRFNELLTGVREDVAIKLYGEDLGVLADKVQEIAAVIRTVPGAADLNVEATSGLPQMTVVYNRAKMAQYGVTVDKLNDYVSASFAGEQASVIFEGEKRFDVVIRLAKEFRQDINSLKNLYIDLPNGAQVPLKEVADISYKPGPMQISRDNTSRRISVGVNVRGRDVKSMVEEIQQKLETDVKLPPGYFVTYGGSFENLQRASDRLMIVVPIALFLIFILLYFALSSFSQSLMIYMAVPLAAIGGVFALWIRGMPFSISAGVGFIVLFGVAVLNGLVLINKFNELKESGMTDLKKRIYEATHERLRPILLTATAAIMGFIPMAVSTSGGAEVQRPLATVVIGGLITATFLTLVIVPVLYYWLESRKEKKNNGGDASYVKKSATVVVVLLSLGGFLSPTSASAQDGQMSQVLTLQEAIALAKENYPSLKESQAFIEREQAMKGTSFDLGNTQVFTGKEEFGNDLPGVQTTIGVQQGNIDLLSGFSKSKFYKARVKLGETFYAVNEQQLIRNVMQAYDRINYNKAQLRFAEQLDSVYANFRTAAELRYDTGETGKLEFIAASSEYQQIQVLRQQAYDDIEIAKRALKQYLGIDQEIETVGQLYEPMDFLANLDSASAANNPLLQYAMQNAEVSKANIGVEKAQFLPKFNFTYGRQIVDDVSGFNTYQAGISIPLWFFPQKSRVKAAKADALVAENQYLEQKAMTESRVSQLIKSLEKTQKTLNYYQEGALLLAEEQITTAELASKEGEIDYVNYITILNSAIRIKQNHIQFINQYNQQFIELQYQLGNL